MKTDLKSFFKKEILSPLKKNKARYYIKNISPYIAGCFGKKTHKNEKSIYFDVDNIDRCLFSLIIFFAENNYSVFLNHRFALRRLNRFGKKLLSFPNVRLCLKKPENVNTCLTSNEEKHLKTGMIFIDRAVFNTIKPLSFYIPYSMYPKIYLNKYFNGEGQHLGIQLRNWKILFAGRISKDVYGCGSIEKLFKMIPRHEAIDYLQEQMADRLFMPENEYDLTQSIQRKKGIVIVPSEKILIEEGKWLETLTRSNFFLALPGCVQPLSHNVIEAMSVGTIPLLEYNGFFNPPLTHEENCIEYSGKDDMVLKINIALNMNEEKIATLRKNVIDYYNSYLKPRAVITNFEKDLSRINRVYLNGESQSVNFFEKKCMENLE